MENNPVENKQTTHIKKPDTHEFQMGWLSIQIDKLAYFVKSSEMAFFITLLGVFGQTFHIYHVVYMISDLQGIPKILNTSLWSGFFALGVLFFSLRMGTGNERENAKYGTTINLFTAFEALINLYYWAYRIIFFPAILFKYSDAGGIDWAQVDWSTFEWSRVEWPSLIIAFPLAIAIPLILRAYAGEIRLIGYSKFVALTKKR